MNNAAPDSLAARAKNKSYLKAPKSATVEDQSYMFVTTINIVLSDRAIQKRCQQSGGLSACMHLYSP
jgi:site-specific recombinase XerC